VIVIFVSVLLVHRLYMSMLLGVNHRPVYPEDVRPDLIIRQRFYVTKSWPVTAPGSQGVFRGRGRGFGFLKNGRQAAIVLSWLLLVQLPGQVLRSYSSKVSKSKRFLIVKRILVYSVTAKLSTEQYLVVRYWFTRMR
jgi:hypothetical protein